MRAVFLFLVAFIVLSPALTAAERAVTMTVSPTEASRSPGSNITVMCRSDLPLAGCNFRVWYTETGGTKKNQDYPVMDFSHGNASVKIATGKFGDNRTELYKAEYSGRGLPEKECGVLLTPSSRGKYLVGCRGRAVTGGWGYGFMALNVVYDQQPHDRNDLRVDNIITVANAGGEARIKHTLAKTDHVLRACRFHLPWNPYLVVVTLSRIVSSPPEKYEAERNDAYCTLTLRNVAKEDNGLWWYWATSNSHSQPKNQYLYFHIIVLTQAPSVEAVSLQLVDYEGPYAPGDHLTATCTASDSRPVAAISWLLGGVTIRHDAVDDVTDADRAWRWPWDVETVTQTVKRKLSAADNGTVLTCQVEHPALKENITKSIEIMVQGGATESSTTTIADNSATIDADSIGTSPTPMPSPSQSSPIVPGTDSDTTTTSVSQDNTVAVVTSCVVLALAVVAAVVYARVARRCCFQPTAGVSNDALVDDDRQRRENPAARPAPTPNGKPRAPSPGRAEAVAGRDVKRPRDEEAVVYAEIAGALTPSGKAKVLMSDDTTYAQLTFH